MKVCDSLNEFDQEEFPCDLRKINMELEGRNYCTGI